MLNGLFNSRRSLVGLVLAIIAIACAFVGPFVLDGISLELLGLILGALGSYFGLQREDRLSKALGVVAVILCFISLFVSGLIGPPQ